MSRIEQNIAATSEMAKSWEVSLQSFARTADRSADRISRYDSERMAGLKRIFSPSFRRKRNSEVAYRDSIIEDAVVIGEGLQIINAMSPDLQKISEQKYDKATGYYEDTDIIAGTLNGVPIDLMSRNQVGDSVTFSIVGTIGGKNISKCQPYAEAIFNRLSTFIDLRDTTREELIYTNKESGSHKLIK